MAGQRVKHRIHNLVRRPPRRVYLQRNGCIRLARPIDLAEQVLAESPGWDRARIDAVLNSQERTVVRLSSKLPVNLTYATVWVAPDGTVQFRPDIYNRDAKLEKALLGRHTGS